MTREAKNYLTDKDIRDLEIKNIKYRKTIGAPKELYIIVNPSGIKKFVIKKENGAFDSFGILKEFRSGIYGVSEARRDANKILKDLSENKDIEVIKGKADKFNYGAYFERFIDYKKKFDRCTDDYLKKMIRTHELYILPSLAKRDIKTIKYSDIIDILNPITQRHKEVENQKNHKYSYLETIRRLVSVIEGVFDIARKDGYIGVNFIIDIRKDFCKSKAYKHIKSADTRLPAITDEQTLKNFLQDLKKDIKMQFQTKNALMLHILSANRPINTVSAKWEYIDFENGVWRIPADDMKMDKAHEIALSEQMLKILKNQYKYTCNGIYVFPANNQNGHLNKDTLGNVIRNIGAENKYNGIASAHGFRATFKTICSQHEAELMQMGIGEKIVEECLAHKENNKVKYAYERNRATLEKKRALMQWYADFLNSIENIF